MTHWTLRMPCRKFLKQYLSNYQPVDPFKLGFSNQFAVFLFSQLDKPLWYNSKDNLEYDSSIDIVIPPSYEKFNRIEVKTACIKAWDAYLYDHFEDRFIAHMNMHSMFNIDYKDAINAFLEQFGLHGMVEIDTLSKKYYRYRKKHGNVAVRYRLTS